jgi:hypothetical protein
MDSSTFICRRLMADSWYQLLFAEALRLKKNVHLNETNMLQLQNSVISVMLFVDLNRIKTV